MLKLFPLRAFSMILICTGIKVHFVVLKEIPALRFVTSNFHTSHGTFSGNVFRVLLWQLLTYLWKLRSSHWENYHIWEKIHIFLESSYYFYIKIILVQEQIFQNFACGAFCSGQPCSFWLQMALTVDGGQIVYHYTVILHWCK